MRRNRTKANLMVQFEVQTLARHPKIQVSPNR
jgi:hypothetical protein